MDARKRYKILARMIDDSLNPSLNKSGAEDAYFQQQPPMGWFSTGCCLLSMGITSKARISAYPTSSSCFFSFCTSHLPHSIISSILY